MNVKEKNYKLFAEWLEKEYKDHYVEYKSYVDEDVFDEDYTAEDLYYEIDNDNGFDEDIIYFSNAMNFLMEHDNSLKESLSIAEEYGYSTHNLTSEVLASLLASKRNRENFPKSEIDDFLSQLDWEKNDEESNNEQ